MVDQDRLISGVLTVLEKWADYDPDTEMEDSGTGTVRTKAQLLQEVKDRTEVGVGFVESIIEDALDYIDTIAIQEAIMRGDKFDEDV